MRLRWWEIALAFFAPRFVMRRVQRRAREQAQRAAAAKAREYGRPARDDSGDWRPLQQAPGAPADLGGVPLHRPRRERWIARRRWY